jgi:hypothetical protein
MRGAQRIPRKAERAIAASCLARARRSGVPAVPVIDFKAEAIDYHRAASVQNLSG